MSIHGVRWRHSKSVVTLCCGATRRTVWS